ncbi:MAG: repair protein radA protein [Candidatus Roizmanbacteria bacterium GW2011_GWC2_41_7]|uniref:DNA repair protein RadA n=2 Tax=Candidatus Roizmaniibacteriota TaxID=1752723 RepID=A0A0G0XDC5_9BACT|nr:MAG: repair protein radA protein [Candidatus Roizmanbacteria bacterium GW2011_GWC2_41_7]
MAKQHSKFTCQQCGFISPQYLGRCPQCGEWNSLVESVEETRKDPKNLRSKDPNIIAQPIKLSDIKPQPKERISTGISELDYVLGGGMVAGQVILLAGEPGVGKSTLLLQVVKSVVAPLAGAEKKAGTNPATTILYTSGEESPEQIGLRARRLGFSAKQNESLTLFAETNMEALLSQLTHSEAYGLLIVDSIQTMYSEALTGAPGSVGQVRECAYQLIQTAKSLRIPTIIVGQVTKEGSIAGPKVLEHLVDTVLYMEGSRFEETRILRVTKNRFGPTDEVGVFSMHEDGLREVTNPSSSFIQQREHALAGQATVVVMEGTRPILVEIQALVAPSELKSPRRVGNGVSFNRLTMICAILSKHLRLPLERFDVYVNVSGGMTIAEPAADLGIAVSIVSSFKNKPLPDKAVAIGELSLLGEVQRVSRSERRIKEAKRLGYTTIYDSSRFPQITHLVKNISR